MQDFIFRNDIRQLEWKTRENAANEEEKPIVVCITKLILAGVIRPQSGVCRNHVGQSPEKKNYLSMDSQISLIEVSHESVMPSRFQVCTSQGSWQVSYQRRSLCLWQRNSQAEKRKVHSTSDVKCRSVIAHPARYCSNLGAMGLRGHRWVRTAINVT